MSQLQGVANAYALGITAERHLAFEPISILQIQEMVATAFEAGHRAAIAPKGFHGRGTAFDWCETHHLFESSNEPQTQCGYETRHPRAT